MKDFKWFHLLLGGSLTVAWILFLNGLSPSAESPSDIWDYVAVPVWVFFVFGVLSVTFHVSESRGLSPWRQFLVTGVMGSLANASLNVVFALVILGLPTYFPEGLKVLMGSEGLSPIGVVGFLEGFLLFSFWALVVGLPHRMEKEKEAQRVRDLLEKEAELARIRATLEPHFVLNTLNAIASMVSEEPHRARELIAALGDLLRDALQDAMLTQRTVREEIAWLRRYAYILETRHPGLAFDWSVEPECEELMIPALLLQPLVENAVHHGAMRRAQGRVGVAVTAHEGGLRCVVVDNGGGYDEATAKSGHGLALIRRRLSLLSEVVTLDIQGSDSGTQVALQWSKGAI